MPVINLGRILEQDKGVHDSTQAYTHPATVQTAGNDWYKTLQDVPVGVGIDDVLYWKISINNSGNAFDYVVAGAPTETSNPTTLGATWVDKLAGRIYVCTDITVDNNIWVSQYYDSTALDLTVADLTTTVEANKSGDVNNDFLVKNGTLQNHAVNVSQLYNIETYSLVADTPIPLPTITSTKFTWAIEIAVNGFTPTWDASIAWDGDGVEPEWTTGSDLVFFYTLDGGTTIKGMMTRAGA